MRKQLPDPEALTARLAARLTVLENRLGGLDDAVSAIRADVAALGRGLADITGGVRDLTNATTGHILRTAGAGGNGTGSGPAAANPGAPADGQGEGEGQPDWIRVTDPDAAAGWLIVVGEFVEEVLPWYGYTPPPCWPLHPGVVAELLALHAQYTAVYAIGDATGVCEWLSRWRHRAGRRLVVQLRQPARPHPRRPPLPRRVPAVV